jgi:hypothetical protein
MRESFTYGSVGRAPGNRCLYPEPDRRGRAALKFYRFLKIIGFLKVYWKPLRQVNRNVGLQGNNE